MRQKLKAAGLTADLLETVYGLGYRLKAPQQKPNADQNVASPLHSTTPLSAKKLASVNKVLQRYQHTFIDRVAVLEQSEASLRQGRLSLALRQEAAQEAHRLAGTLGSFGYGAGSKLAGAIEHLLLHSTLEPADSPPLTKLVAALKQELTQPPTPLTLEPSPASTHHVLVIDDETPFTQRLRAEAFAWGFCVEVAPDLETAQRMLSQHMPDAVLLNLSPPKVKAALTLLETLRVQWSIVPVLVMTEHDRLIDRVTVSRLGVRRFLTKAIGTVQIFEALSQMLFNASPTDARVMLVDDDPVMLEGLRNHLKPWGLQITSLQDSNQFWDVLTATKPDLLVMDLEMPTFNGIDLCRVVRQDVQWGNLPILVVTVHTDMASIQQVFAAGADDFISKPVVGPELVTRVISRIDRSRLQHELETLKRRMTT